MHDELTRKRDAVLTRLVRFGAIAGIVAFLPGVAAGVAERLWAVVIVDTISFAAVIAVALTPRAGPDWKLVVLIGASLATGAVVLISTGPLGAGYVWLVFAVVISALFGKPRIIGLTIALVMAIMIAWGVALRLGAEGYGADPKNVAIIAASLLVICLGLAMVITRLLAILAAALDEKSMLADSLARELGQTNEVKERLEITLDVKDGLLRELQHRVRNNLQVVQSLLSVGEETSAYDSPDLQDARRRIRALSAANDIFLSRPELSFVDAYDLVRSVAHQSVGRDRDEHCRVEASDAFEVSLDPQTASVVAVLVSDLVSALGGSPVISMTGKGSLLRLVIRNDGAIGAQALAAAYRNVADGRIAKGAAPEVTIGLLADRSGSGPAIYLEAGGRFAAADPAP